MKRITNYFGLLLALTFSFSFGGYAQTIMPSRGLCAHRGDTANYPENTIPAFQEAIKMGAQMIEFDLRLTKDSVLVIMHDPTVDRTTNGHGYVSDLTYKQITKLYAGHDKGERFNGVGVPTFKEVLAIMPRNIWLNCHLKAGPYAARKATEIIVKGHRLKQAFLACDIKEAHAARSINSHVLICNMSGQWKHPHRYARVTIKEKSNFIQFFPGDLNRLTKQLIDSVKEHGIKVNYFQTTPYTPQEIGKLFKMGIDFPLVSDISRFMPVAERLGIKPVVPQF